MFYSLDRVKGLFSAIPGGSPGFQFRGAWNANTNSPTLASGVGTQGDTYIVSVAGTTTLDGFTDWEIGDFAVFGLSTWSKIDNTESTLDSLVLLPTGLTNISATNLNSVNYTQAGASTILQIPGAETFTPGTRFDLVRFSNDEVSIQAESPVVLNGVTGGAFSLRENNARVTLVKISNPNNWQLNFWQDLQDSESVNILPTGTVTLTDSYINSVNVNQTGAPTTLEIPNSETYRSGTKFDVLKLAGETFSVGVDTLININGANSPVLINNINDRATLVKVSQPHDWQLNFWQLDIDSSTLQTAYNVGDGTITQVPAGAKPLVFDDVTISNAGPATIHASGTTGFLTITNMTSFERDAVAFPIPGHLNLNAVSDTIEFRSSAGWSSLAISSSFETFTGLFIQPFAGLITTIDEFGIKVQDSPETQSIQITEQSVTLDNAAMKSTGPATIHASGTAGFLTATNMNTTERNLVAGQIPGHLNLNSVSDRLEFRTSLGWSEAAIRLSNEAFASLVIGPGTLRITNIDSSGIDISDNPLTKNLQLNESSILLTANPAAEETEILHNSVEVRDDDLTNRAQILKDKIRLFSPSRNVILATDSGIEVNNIPGTEVTQVTEFGLSGTNLVIDSTNDTDFTPGGSLTINGGNFFDGVAPTTTKGDLIVHNNAGANIRLGVGSDGDIPIADSSQPEGIRWGAVTAAITDENVVNLPSGITQLTASVIDNLYVNNSGSFSTLEIPNTETYPIGTQFQAIREYNQPFLINAQSPKNINGFGGTQLTQQYSRAIVVKVATNDWRLSFWDLDDNIQTLNQAYQNGDGTINVLPAKPLVFDNVSIFDGTDGDTTMRVSGTTGFFRITDMTNAQRNALTPENGSLNYGFDSGKLEVRSLGVWRDVAYSDTDETFNTLVIDDGGLITTVNSSGIKVNDNPETQSALLTDAKLSLVSATRTTDLDATSFAFSAQSVPFNSATIIDHDFINLNTGSGNLKFIVNLNGINVNADGGANKTLITDTQIKINNVPETESLTMNQQSVGLVGLNRVIAIDSTQGIDLGSLPLGTTVSIDENSINVDPGSGNPKTAIDSSGISVTDSPLTDSVNISNNSITVKDNPLTFQSEILYNQIQLRDAGGTSFANTFYDKFQVDGATRDINMIDASGLTVFNKGNSKGIIIDEVNIAATHELDIAYGTTFTLNGGNFFDGVAPTTTHGDLIVHNNAGTNVRVPAGLNDTILVGDSTVAAGVSYKTADQLALRRNLATQISSATVTNTAAETTLLGTLIGSAEIAINTINVGTSFKLDMGGVFENVNTSETIRIRAYIGSTLIADTGDVTTASISVPSCFEFRIKNAIFRTIGGTSTLYSSAVLEVCDDSSNDSFVLDASLTNVTTIDTTVSNTIDITATWGSASVDNVITAHTCTIERTR